MTDERPIDASYPSAALTRAGRPIPQGPVETEDLHGGRTGARVVRLGAGGRSYVLKIVPGDGWRREDLGPGVRCPVLDVDVDPLTGAAWMLMEVIVGMNALL